MSADLYALTGRELDTVLAALRLWQLMSVGGLTPELLAIVRPKLLAIAANGARPLDTAETDALAARLTFAGFTETARRRAAP